jgi:hypothetical protein
LNTDDNIRGDIQNDDSIINKNNQICSKNETNNVESNQGIINNDNMNIGKNDLSQQGITDDYFQNTEITSELQANAIDNKQSSTSDRQKDEKLFDHQNSNNFLYSSNNSSQINPPEAEDVLVRSLLEKGRYHRVHS